MLVFTLSKEDLRLSKKEALSLAGEGKHEMIDRMLLVETPWDKRFKRLAYTSSVREALFICRKDDLKRRVRAFNWGGAISKRFNLKAHGSLHPDEITLAGMIHASMQREHAPSCKKKNRQGKQKAEDFCSETIHLDLVGDKVIAAKEIWRNREDFSSRRPDKLPEFHPSSLKPRLARAMINLTGIRDGKIIDPCCGAGGFLIEAGIMGIDAKGYDIDRIMVNRARINLKSMGLRPDVEEKDCLTLSERFSYLVTDLPYGKNTKNIEAGFYKGFMEMLARGLQGTAVIGYPKGIDLPGISRFKIEGIFEHRLHKSLVKKIIILKSCV